MEINPTQKSEQNSHAIKNKIWIAVGIISLTIIVLFLFKTLFNLLLLVLAGVLMCVYFHGCASIIKRKLKLGNTFSLILSILINSIIICLFLWFVGARISSQIDELSKTLPQTLENARNWLSNQPMGPKILDYADNSMDSGKASATIKSLFSSTFGIISDFYIVLLLGLFFTANPNIYRRGVIHLIPPSGKRKTAELWDQANILLRKWLKGQIFGFFFIAILSGLGLWALGMPLILTLALVAGLLNFIPNFGPIIALVPAALLALMQGPQTALLVIGLYTFIQIIQSTVTQPLIQKKMVSVPPGLLAFGQVGMGILAGFWGVLLATPILAILMTLINKLYVDRQEDRDFESTE